MRPSTVLLGHRQIREADSLPRSGFPPARSAFPWRVAPSVVAQRATSCESRGDELFPPLLAIGWRAVGEASDCKVARATRCRTAVLGQRPEA